MPELPDVSVYLERLTAKVVGHRLERVRHRPPVPAAHGDAADQRRRRPARRRRRAPRQAHRDRASKATCSRHPPDDRRPPALAARRRQEDGAATRSPSSNSTPARSRSPRPARKRRASLHVVAGRAALAALDAGGIDVLAATLAAFAARLVAENHTLKRALTDPRLFSGIGNAYSDEILHRARLSPLALTRSLDDGDDRAPASTATRAMLAEWTERLRAEAGDWPEKVTAFHRQMAVHGRYRPAVPGLRRAGAAHRPRRQRDQLLRALPDRRQGCSPTGRCRACSRAAGRSTSTSCSESAGTPTLRAGCAASRRSARGRQALRQQVGGRLVAGLLDQREDAARGARDRLVALDQDRAPSRAPSAASPATSLIELRRPNCAYEPGAGWPSERIRSAIGSTAFQSSVYCAMNIRCSVLNIGPVTFQWKLCVVRYSV